MEGILSYLAPDDSTRVNTVVFLPDVLSVDTGEWFIETKSKLLASKIKVPLIEVDEFDVYCGGNNDGDINYNQGNEENIEEQTEIMLFLGYENGLKVVSSMEIEDTFDIKKVIMKDRSLDLMKTDRKKALKHHLPTQLITLHKEISTALDITIPVDYIEHYFGLGGSSCRNIKEYDEQNINTNTETCEKRMARMNKMLKKIVSLVQELSGKLGPWLPIIVGIIRRAAETISLIISKPQSLLGAYTYIHTDGYSKVLKQVFGVFDYKSRFYDPKAELIISQDKLFEGYQDIPKLSDDLCKINLDQFVENANEITKLNWEPFNTKFINVKQNILGVELELDLSFETLGVKKEKTVSIGDKNEEMME